MTSILLASLALAVLGLLATWLLRRFKIQSPLLHRLTWGLVLAQGIMLAGIPLQVPVLEPAPAMVSGFSSTNEITIPAVSLNQSVVEIPAAVMPAPTREHSIFTKPGPIFFWIYVTGIAAVSGYSLLAYLLLIRAVRKSRPAPDSWQAQWRNLLNSRGLNEDSIPLRIHSALGPMLCRLPGGYSVIVPQEAWARLTKSQRRAVLEHEIAHVKRGDIWKSFAARVVATLHWFNPVAWWSARQFEEAAEWDCDRRLSEKGKQHAVEYARALLQFAEPKSSLPIGASLARGAALSPRIQRLTSSGSARESLLKRLGFVLVIIGFTCFAMIRIELIAQESKAPHLEIPTGDFRSKLSDFSEKIEGSGDLLKAFQKTITSPAGQIVMKDRAQSAAREERKRKAQTALADYMEKYFEKNKDSGKLKLRAEFADYRSGLIETKNAFEADIEPLQKVLTELKNSISPDTDAEQLLLRVAEAKGAAPLLYALAVRDKMRPSTKAISQRLSSILSDDGEGNLVVPPSREEQGQQVADLGETMQQVTKEIGPELLIYADEMATPDEVHKRLKAALQEPLFAVFIAAEVGEKARENNTEFSVTELFESLEEAFIDKGDGLHINPEASEEVGELLAGFELVTERISAIREPLKKFASRIKDDNELHRALKTTLLSEGAAVLLSREIAVSSADAGEVFLSLVGSVLEKGKDGKTRVREDAREELIDDMQSTLRTIREARRLGRQFDELAAQVEDPELIAIYQSPAGKLIVGQAILEGAKALSVNGLALWIDRHFVTVEGDAVTLRANANKELERVVADAKEIAANLKSEF